MKPLYPEALQKMLAGRTMYADLEPSRPDLRRWVKFGRFQRHGKWRYFVYSFEIPQHIVEAEYDAAGHEENAVHHDVEDLEEAIAILAELIPHTVEWKTWNETDCPL